MFLTLTIDSNINLVRQRDQGHTVQMMIWNAICQRHRFCDTDFKQWIIDSRAPVDNTVIGATTPAGGHFLNGLHHCTHQCQGRQGQHHRTTKLKSTDHRCKPGDQCEWFRQRPYKRFHISPTRSYAAGQLIKTNASKVLSHW